MTNNMQGMANSIHGSMWQDILTAIRKRVGEGESQSSLAAQLGVNRATLSRWLAQERGGKRASLDALLGYMDELDLDPAPYVGGEPAGEQPVFLPWLRVDLPGDGPARLSTDVPSHLAFLRSWLMARGRPEHLAVIPADGGMAPTIPDGAAVMVSLERRAPINGRIHLVRLDNEVTLARLRLDADRNVHALYGDDGAPARPVTAERHLEVLGRTVWFSVDVT